MRVNDPAKVRMLQERSFPSTTVVSAGWIFKHRDHGAMHLLSLTLAETVS